MNQMKASDGYPIECYGSYYEKRRGVHDICRKCAIYQPSKVNPVKPHIDFKESTNQETKIAHYLN